MSGTLTGRFPASAYGFSAAGKYGSCLPVETGQREFQMALLQIDFLRVADAYRHYERDYPPPTRPCSPNMRKGDQRVQGALPASWRVWKLYGLARRQGFRHGRRTRIWPYSCLLETTSFTLTIRFEMYGSFIGKELIEFTRKTFPLSQKREDTLLQGAFYGDTAHW